MMDTTTLLRLVRAGESEKVEFKARPGNDLHKVVTAFANTVGGVLLVGVDDLGEIVGTDVQRAQRLLANALQAVTPPVEVVTHTLSIDEKDVLAVEVPKASGLSAVGGVAYLRSGAGIRPLSLQEVMTLSVETGAFEWDRSPRQPLETARAEYLDWFFQQVEKAHNRTIAAGDRERFLRSLGAVSKGKLTNAGVLFFTDAIETIPHAGIRLVYLEGDEPAGSKEYGGPLWQVIETAYTDLVREVGKAEEVVGSRRLRWGGYPARALREALINAVAHRNYAVAADVRVFIHAEKVVIRSPGGLMPMVDLTDPEHIARNPSLCNLLFNAGFIERYGYGVRMMRAEVAKHTHLRLDFDLRPQRVEVVFRQELQTLLDGTDRRLLAQLTTPQRSGKLATNLGLSKPALLRRLKKLEGLGLVKKQGRGPQTRYRSV